MSSRRSERRIYVGRVSRRTQLKDLEHVFGKYGRIRDIDIKHDYAFIVIFIIFRNTKILGTQRTLQEIEVQFHFISSFFIRNILFFLSIN